SGNLTLIVSQDPMYVTFPVSQREFLTLRVNPKDLKVKIRFADGTTYNQLGTINFVDVSVDRATDTVLVRATMPNPDGVLIDGQLVTVVLEAEQPQEKVVVPQAALIADPGRHLCLRGRGRQSSHQAHQTWRRNWTGCYRQ